MKKIFVLPVIFSILALTVFFQSCNEDLATNFAFDPYEFASLDENGGTWVPILLTSSSQVPIAAPNALGSPEYTAEVAALKVSLPT